VEHWELIAREMIRDLVASYAHFADTGRFDELANLFTEDGVLKGGEEPEAKGREGIRRFLKGTNTSLAASTKQAMIRHHVSNLLITVRDPTLAEGSSYFFVVTERGPDHWGRYRDTYACVEGRWQFRYRRARMDGYAPSSWVAERRAPAPG